MISRPKIDVCMTSWPNSPARLGYFTRTIEAIYRHLCACGFVLSFHCSAESRGTEGRPVMRDELEQLCRRFHVKLHWREGNPDLGASMNAALEMGSGEFVLMLQDDFELIGPFSIAPSVMLLTGHPEFCAVRYHCPANQAFRESTVDGFRVVDLARSPWPFTDSPSFRQRSMVEQYGPYTEGLPHRAAEYRYGKSLVQQGAKVAATQLPIFRHIGKIPAVHGRVPLES